MAAAKEAEDDVQRGPVIFFILQDRYYCESQYLTMNGDGVKVGKTSQFLELD